MDEVTYRLTEFGFRFFVLYIGLVVVFVAVCLVVAMGYSLWAAASTVLKRRSRHAAVKKGHN